MSVRSVYTYIDKGLFTARNIDLKRKTKFRPRKCRKTQITNREVFSGRMYSDFLLLDPDYIERAAEMDTVHYEVALWTYGARTLKELQLRPIPPDEVNLTPKLIRYNH